MVRLHRAGEIVERAGARLFEMDVEVGGADGGRYAPSLPVAVAEAWAEKAAPEVARAEKEGLRFVVVSVTVGGVVYSPVLSVGVAKAAIGEIARALGPQEE